MQIRLFVFLLFIIWSIGCAPARRTSPAYIPPCLPGRAAPSDWRPKYIVRKGDSLWMISKKYGISVDALMRENDISTASRIFVGQKIYIPTCALSYKKEGLFLFPVQGRIEHYFGEVIDNKINNGIKIRPEGDAAVCAVGEGKVVFYNYLKGYGNTLIIEHADGFSTVYANLSEVPCNKGDTVRQGQSIGIVAENSSDNNALLHFEVRKGFKADDPLLYVKQ